MKQKPPLEKHVEQEILKQLHFKGILAWKNASQGTYDVKRKAFRATTARKGVSDIIGCLRDGRFLAIEVKRKPNKPTQLQLEFIEEVNENGGLAFVAYSWEDVKHELLKAGYL